jgi:hypothetical protein
MKTLDDRVTDGEPSIVDLALEIKHNTLTVNHRALKAGVSAINDQWAISQAAKVCKPIFFSGPEIPR